MLSSLRLFDASEVANQRVKIIRFYEKHGEAATMEAFGANRKVISRWRKLLKESNGDPAGLIPRSTPSPAPQDIARAPQDHCVHQKLCAKNIRGWGRRRSSPSWMRTVLENTFPGSR